MSGALSTGFTEKVTRLLGKKGQMFILALLLCFVVVDLFLIKKVSALSASTESCRTALSDLLTRSSLHVGALPGPVRGKSVSGGAVTVDFDQAKIPTVLYAFTAECPWCKRNLPNLQVLIGSAGIRYRLIGLALSRAGLKEYLTAEKLSFPVVADIDSKTWSAYALGTTPETIVVSPEGKVQKIWFGAYNGNDVKDIDSYLGVRLSAAIALPFSTTSEPSK